MRTTAEIIDQLSDPSRTRWDFSCTPTSKATNALRSRVVEAIATIGSEDDGWSARYGLGFVKVERSEISST